MNALALDTAPAVGIDEPGAAEPQLIISRELERCHVLGPGVRFVIWVQGCPLRCTGCVAEELLPFEGGHPVQVTVLARRIAVAEVTGVTFSGGEPFAQAASVAAVIREVRRQRPDFSAMSYSGYPLEWLRSRGSAAQQELLGLLDILIDGPYVERLHAPLRWRGSSNQRLRLLSGRHAAIADEPDASAGIEVALDASSTLSWAGVPPIPGFRDRLRASLTGKGLEIKEIET